MNRIKDIKEKLNSAADEGLECSNCVHLLRVNEAVRKKANDALANDDADLWQVIENIESLLSGDMEPDEVKP